MFFSALSAIIASYQLLAHLLVISKLCSRGGSLLFQSGVHLVFVIKIICHFIDFTRGVVLWTCTLVVRIAQRITMIIRKSFKKQTLWSLYQQRRRDPNQMEWHRSKAKRRTEWITEHNTRNRLTAHRDAYLLYHYPVFLLMNPLPFLHPNPIDRTRPEL